MCVYVCVCVCVCVCTRVCLWGRVWVRVCVGVRVRVCSVVVQVVTSGGDMADVLQHLHCPEKGHEESKARKTGRHVHGTHGLRRVRIHDVVHTQRCEGPQRHPGHLRVGGVVVMVVVMVVVW